MKVKYLLGIVMFILLSLNVFGASACNVDQNCYLYHEVTENETTSVLIQLTNEWGAMIVNDSMTQYHNQTYQYVYVFTAEGNYNYTALIYNDTTLLSSNYELVVIAEGSSYNVYLILGFIFILLMIVMSLAMGENLLGLFSSIALLVIGITFVYQIQIIGWLMIVASLMLGMIFTFKKS